MRCFIAIDLPQEIKDNVNSWIAQCILKQKEGIQYVNSHSLHLTLKFLGEVEPAKLEAVKDALKQISFDPIKLRVKGAGAFPNLVFPKVLWVGINESPEATKLALDVDEAMAGLGFLKEGRPFHPHITIGRVKGIPDKALLEFIKNSKEIDFGGFQNQSVILFQSELTREGPIYNRILTVER